MNQNEVNQIINIITNIEKKKGYIPYFSDLENHEILGPVFQNISPDNKREIQDIINKYIAEKIDGMTKTK